MLIQIISDLHLETYPSYTAYKHTLTDASYLALLGDIGHVASADFEKLIELFLDHYAIVFYLLGNHDPKGLSMEGAKKRVRALEARLASKTRERTVGRFVFLEKTRVDLDSRISVLGCTLFSHVPEAAKPLVESRMIEFRETAVWTVGQHNAAHAEDVAWLNGETAKEETEEPQRSVVILTHHCPSRDPRASDPKHRNSDMMPAFSADLSGEKCWNSPCVRIWSWGHTHWNCEFEAQRDEAPPLKCFANQKGYYRFPSATYDGSVLVELSEGRTHRETSGEDRNEPKLETDVHREGGKSASKQVPRRSFLSKFRGKVHR